MDCVFFIEIKVRLAQTLESLVAYWQHLDMACPQQAPTNGVINPDTSHDTTKVNTMVMVEILPPSSLTYTITPSNEPMFCKDFIDLQNHGIPESFDYLKKTNGYMTRLPIVIQKMHDENKCVHSRCKHP
jgi:hypothetical protein